MKIVVNTINIYMIYTYIYTYVYTYTDRQKE